MKCTNNTEKYKNLASNFLKTDPDKFSNFDNVATFILSSPLKDNAKTNALHHLALIYVQLEKASNGEIRKGNAELLKPLVDLISANDEAYLEAVKKDIYPNIDSKTVSKPEVVAAFNVLGKIKNFTTIDPSFSKLLDTVDTYLLYTKFKSAQDKLEAITELNNLFDKLVQENIYTIPLRAAFDTKLSKHMNLSSFVNTGVVTVTSDMSGEFDRTLLQLKDGRYIDAYKTAEGYYMNYNTEELVDSSEILSTRPFLYLPQANKFTDTPSNVFFDSFVRTGIQVQDIDPNVGLSTSRNPIGEIKFYAVPLSEDTDNRIELFKELAEADPSYKEIAVKEHETFESSQQVNYLQKHPGSVVATLSSPKKSEQGFVITGEFNGKRFNVYTLDNFVFLNSENSTQKIDFSNPKDLELVAQTIIKRTGTENSKLVPEDIASLKEAYTAMQKFKKAVIDAHGSFEDKVDVSDLFHSHFSVNSIAASQKSHKSLADIVKEESDLSIPLTIVSTDEDGNILGQEERLIPFILTRRADTDTFMVASILNNNEGILYNGKVISESLYLEQVLLNGENISDFAKNILTVRDQAQEKLILRFSEGKLSGRYKPVALNHVTNPRELFSSFLGTLVGTLNSTNRMYEMATFSNKYYEIPLRSSARNRGEAVLDFKFSVDKVGGLVLEIRPFSRNDRYKTIINASKLLFNIKLPENKIKDIYRFLVHQGFTPENIKLAEDQFITYMKNEVLSRLENPEDHFGEAFGKLFREDFTFKGVFNPGYILFEYDKDNNITNFKLKRKKLAGAVDDRTFNLNTLYVVDTLSDRRSLIAPRLAVKAITPVDIPVEKIVKEEQVRTEELEEKVKKAEPLKREIESDEDLHFSLLDEAYEKASEQDFQNEVAWLQSTYHMFDLKLEDIDDIKTLTEIDSKVLGYVKDRVIHLNTTLKGSGVAYHEAFHAVFGYLLNQSERTKLLNEVYSKNPNKFTQDALIEFAEQRNYTESFDKLKELYAEEILADGFQKYMLSKAAPKTLLQKFYEILKNIIRFFVSNETVIDSTFRNIKSGVYATREIAELNNDDVKYLAIPGLPIIYHNLETDKVRSKSSTLTSLESSQLVGMVVSHILKNDAKVSFDEKFEAAAEHLINNVYNIDILTAQTDSSEAKKELTEEFFNTWNQYRFILGARLKGIDVYDINQTGSDAYSANVATNNYKDSLTGEVKPNTNGEESKQMLKDLVLKTYKSLQYLVQESAEDKESDAEFTDYEDVTNEVVTEDSTENLGAEELGEDPMDDYSEFTQKNVLDSLPRQIKRFLAVNTYNMPHKKYNSVMIPRVIDGNAIFPVLLKITSDIKTDKIIDQLYNAAAVISSDGNYEYGQDIKMIYENIKEHCSIDPVTNLPTRNKQLYNMMVETLNVTAMNYSLFNVFFKRGLNDMQEEESFISSISLKDKILYEDINKKKKDIVDKFIITYNKNFGTAEYTKALDTLSKLIAEIKSKSSILETIDETNNAVLLTKSKELTTALKAVGLNFPESLLRLSLIGIETVDNKKGVALKGIVEQHYLLNEDFIKSEKYLNKAFFNDLYEILKAKPTPEVLNSQFDDASKSYGSFNAILRKASEYIVKYDPTELPSVIRNAEGKLIYRYVKSTPVIQMAKSLSVDGFKDLIKDDVEYKTFLKDFYKSNPYFKVLLSEQPLTEQEEILKEKVELFFKNFDISLFGGSQQSVNGEFTQGSSYYHLDRASMYLLDLFSFIKRSEVSGKKATVQTFMRQHAQNETSPTNFMISGMYEQFANFNGPVKENGRLKIVSSTFLPTIAQEYERIRRAWADKDSNLEKFNTGIENNFRLKYNAELKKDGTVDNTKASLRAYNFSKLPKFFESYPDIKQQLIESAKAGLKFEQVALKDVNTTINSKKVNILDALEKYALDQLNLHIEEYVNNGILKPVQVAKIVGGIDKTTDSYIVEKRFGQISKHVKYTSPYFNTESKVQIGYTMYSLSDLYGNIKNYGNILKSENEEYVKYKFENVDLENFIMDKVFNHMHNSLMFNQIFDGDEALNVKNAVDYVKRNKRFIIAGNNFKNGYHKVAFINQLQVFLHPEYLTAGQFYSIDEIEDHPFLDEETKDILIDSFLRGENFVDVFDGQSYTSIMHQMDGFEKIGKLSEESINILIAKHYRDITEQEFETLQKDKIVLNPKKTTTGSRTLYLKLSESYIDRNDVSTLVIPAGLTAKEEDEFIENTYAELHAIYSKIYSLKQENQLSYLEDKSSPDIALRDTEIKKLVVKAHSYFAPKKSKAALHSLLNSMEFYNVDQVVDPTASKNTTMLPVQFNEKLTPGGDDLINLQLSSQNVSNEFKYNQVETSRLKNESKVSIQRKILIPADIPHMEEILGRELDETEKEVYSHLMKSLNDYHLAMKGSAVAGYNSLRTFLRDENNNYNLGKIYDIIRESLELQGASENMKDMFKTDAAGNPIINQNIPAIRKMIEYYFFSLYSKATDEKSTGTKFIHCSSYGHNVTVDENNNVIPESVIEANPDLYEDAPVRSLGITTEVDANGFTTYYVEALIPRPYFLNKGEEKFYLEKLNKFYGTRIPTEDKRSMLVIKVVDFINSAHGNTIILPYVAHYLAGSDFDIDTLYTQMYNTYRNMNGKLTIYGDYSKYRNEAEGRFLEFLKYKQKDKEIRLLTAKKYEELAEGDFKLASSTQKVLVMLGYEEDDINKAKELFNTSDFKSLIADLSSEIKTMIDDKKSFIEDTNYGDIKAVAKVNSAARARRNELLTEINSMNFKIQEKIAAKKELSKAFRIYKDALKVQAMLKVYSKYGIPTSLSGFNKKPEYKYSVRPLYQNELLNATMNILSNELVFKHLYINQKSSTESYDKILDTQEIDYKDVSKNFPFDHHSIAGVISSKSLSQSDKGNVGISANTNKIMGFINQMTPANKPNVKSKEVVFKYNVPVYDDAGNIVDYELISYDRYGVIDKNTGARVIQKVGDSIGMFTDAGKEPKPALLGINDVNSSFVLSVVSLGLDDNFALNLLRLPEYVNACKLVQSSKQAITETGSVSNVSLSKALTSQLTALQNAEPDALDYLKSVDIVDKKGSKSNFKINKENLVLDFTPKALNKKALNSNTLTLNDLGITISGINPVYKEVKDGTGKVKKEKVGITKISLTDIQQKLILMKLIKEQSAQTFQLSQIGSLINTLKSVKPDFKSFEFMYKNIQQLKNGELFLEDDVVDEIFSENKLWSTQYEIFRDLNEQSGLLFLERSGYFGDINRVFSETSKNKSAVASILPALLATYKFKSAYPGSRKGVNASQQTLIDIDDANLINSFTARYWFSHGLKQEIDSMKEAYPNNKFLSFLREYKTDNYAISSDKTKFHESYIGLVSKSKISGKLEQDLIDDAKYLTAVEPLFMSKLFYHELARTGLQYKPHSFMRLLDPVYLKQVSKYMNEFIETLKDNSTTKKQAIADFIQASSEEELTQILNNMFENIAVLMTDDIENKEPQTLAFFEGSYHASFINKGKINDYKESETDKPASIISREMLKYLTQITNGYQFNRSPKSALLFKSSILPGDEISFDFSYMHNLINPGLNIEIARRLGINFDYATMQYSFPAILKIDEKLFLLKDVGDSGDNEFFDNSAQSLAENFVNNIDTGGIKRIGTKATYQRLNTAKVKSMQTLNPGSLSIEETKTYFDLIDTPKLKTKNIQYIDVVEEEVENKISSTQDTSKNPSDYTNHSGGAYGGDTFWDLIGREFGVTNHNHYKDSGNASLSKQLRDAGVKAEILSKEQMDFARTKVKELLGITYKDDIRGNLQVRNFYQVYNADAVYAIAKINSDKISVSGGTNTAVQLGIKLNKPVYVWDINTEQWYKFNGDIFEKTETPVLTKNFAGVGTRDIENYNVQVDGKWQSRKEYVGAEKEQKAKQAIRDVYAKTFNTSEQESATSYSEDILKLYSKLGNKTVSKNVVIRPWSELKNSKEAITPQGIISTRIPNSNEHFGNPFSHNPIGKTKGLIKTQTVKEAVEKYIDWVVNSQDSRAIWIRQQLDSGKLRNKPILYYKELGEPSHATALDYLINNWEIISEPLVASDYYAQSARELQDLELAKEMLEYKPEMIILKELPKILPESAIKETRLSLGAGKDINPTLLSKSGKTVAQAAHDIVADHFYEDPVVDTEYVRNVIIEILSSGKNNYLRTLTKQDRIEYLQKELNNLSWSNVKDKFIEKYGESAKEIYEQMSPDEVKHIIDNC